MDRYNAELESEAVELAIREKIGITDTSLTAPEMLSELVSAFEKYPRDSDEVRRAQEGLFNALNTLYWLSMRGVQS